MGHSQGQPLMLWSKSDDGRLRHGSIVSIAKMFGVSKKTWKQGKTSLEIGKSANTDSIATGRVGRKRILVESKEIASIPLSLRTNIRSMAEALKKPKSTVFVRIKEGLARRHSSAIKPALTEENKKEAL